MSRSFARRFLAAVSAIWLAANIALPTLTHACPRHDAPVVAAHVAHHQAASEHTVPASKPGSTQDKDDCCSCPGAPCAGTPAALLAGAAQSPLPFSEGDSGLHTTAVADARPLWKQHALPYAQAPPDSGLIA